MLQSVEKFSHVRFAGKAADLDMARRNPRRAFASHAARPVEAAVHSVLTHEQVLIHDILRRAGVQPGEYRTSSLMRRVPSCLRALKVKSIGDALVRLASNSGALELAANALLIGVTDFFRDPAAYEQLRHTVIPELLRTEGRIRILSAACSDGAELYSLGMCLAEKDVLARTALIGVDCRKHALERAQDGWYSEAAIHGIPAGCRAMFVRPDLGGYRVIDPIRVASTWYQADICRFTGDAPYHLIACRNIAIYLDPEAAERLWSRLRALLAPGGYLFAGKAERPRDGFIRTAPCLFKKVEA